jgi:hypothetical protein
MHTRGSILFKSDPPILLTLKKGWMIATVNSDWLKHLTNKVFVAYHKIVLKDNNVETGWYPCSSNLVF